MASIANLKSQNHQKVQPKKQAVSYLARYVAGVLVCYSGHQGMKSATWQRDRVNERLERDGYRPISRATFFRAKAELRDGGHLHFKSTAWRRRDRNRPRDRANQRQGGHGRRMIVLSIPFAAEGRRPRRAAKPNETFGAPPLNETFVAPTPLIDLSPKKDLEQESRSGGTTAAPSIRRAHDFSEDCIESEESLTRIAEHVSAEMKVPWKPLPERWSWRCGAIRKTGIEDYGGMSVIVVGMALQRARDIERARDQGKYHDFWEVGEGDVVARALTYDHSDPLWRKGAKWLWNNYGIDCEREGFEGIEPPPLSRAEEIYREAMVGAS